MHDAYLTTWIKVTTLINVVEQESLVLFWQPDVTFSRVIPPEMGVGSYLFIEIYYVESKLFKIVTNLATNTVVVMFL